MEGVTRQAAGQEAGPLARAVARAAGWATIGEPLRIFTTLGRHRRLFRAWLPFGATLLLRTRLPRADVEAVVLRTARNCSCAYEWAQHVPLARRAGLSAADVAAIAGRGDDGPALSRRRRALVRAVDELAAHGAVSRSTWDELGAFLDEEQLLEVCMLAGHYTMLAMTLNSFGVRPEPAALERLGAAERDTALRLDPARPGGS